MNHLDLFSGIGGFALAARRVGWDTIGFCEIDPWCQKVLAKHWPGVPIYDDIKEVVADTISERKLQPQGRKQNIRRWIGNSCVTNGATTVGPVDIVTGGFPCQDISYAGKGAGIDGERSGLWTELARIIGEVRPRYAILENVSALISGRDNYKLPVDRCVCGWPYRWRGLPVRQQANEQDGERALRAENRCGNDGESPSPIEKTEKAIRRGIERNTQGDGEMGRGVAMGADRQKGATALRTNAATPGAKDRTGETLNRPDEKRRGSNQGADSGTEPEGAEYDIDNSRWVCPSCGRPVADSATRSCQPTWLGRVHGDLASIGYDCEWHCIPASAVGAPHRRDRIWIIAYPQHSNTDDAGSYREEININGKAELSNQQVSEPGPVCKDVADPSGQRQPRPRLFTSRSGTKTNGEGKTVNAFAGCVGDQWATEPTVCGMDDGLSDGLDGYRGRVANKVPNRVDRLKGLGNAIVPQVAEVIFRAINEVHHGENHENYEP